MFIIPYFCLFVEEINSKIIIFLVSPLSLISYSTLYLFTPFVEQISFFLIFLFGMGQWGAYCYFLINYKRNSIKIITIIHISFIIIAFIAMFYIYGPYF